MIFTSGHKVGTRHFFVWVLGYVTRNNIFHSLIKPTSKPTHLWYFFFSDHGPNTVGTHLILVGSVGRVELEVFFLITLYASEITNHACLFYEHVSDRPPELNVKFWVTDRVSLQNPTLRWQIIECLVYLIVTRPNILYVAPYIIALVYCCLYSSIY